MRAQIGADRLYDTVDMTAFRMNSHAEHPDSEFVERYGKSLEHSGFVVLTGTGVPDEVIENAYTAMRKLFAFTDAELGRYNGDATGGQRGFTKYKKERAKTQPVANLMRFWMVGREYDTDALRTEAGMLPNIWPDELVPEFRAAMTAYYQAMEQLNTHLLRAQELYLELPKDTLQEMMRTGDTIARVLHYPALDLNENKQAANEDPEAVRAYEHEDIGWQTLLPRSTEGGLEVMSHDGAWHKVVAPPGSVINNFADTGQAWIKYHNLKRTLRSTTHRVTNGTGAERFSLPYFVHPKGSTILDPKTGWTALEYLIKRLVEIGLISEDTLA